MIFEVLLLCLCSSVSVPFSEYRLFSLDFCNGEHHKMPVLEVQACLWILFSQAFCEIPFRKCSFVERVFAPRSDVCQVLALLAGQASNPVLKSSSEHARRQKKQCSQVRQDGGSARRWHRMEPGFWTRGTIGLIVRSERGCAQERMFSSPGEGDTSPAGC